MNPASEVLGFLKPRPCPYGLVRIGGSGDGAYLLPNDLGGIKACFSPGVCNYKHFEDELALLYGVHSHMCDYSSDIAAFETPMIEGMQTFEKKWLDLAGAEHSISLEGWIKRRQPEDGDLLLQMDIEGAEYRNICSTPVASLSRFRIIVMELHGLNVIQSSSTIKGFVLGAIGSLWVNIYGLLPRAIKQNGSVMRILNYVGRRLGSHLLFATLKKIAKTHDCVHAHPNNCCGDFVDQKTGINFPRVIEVTYLRKDRFPLDSSRFIQPQLPHPLDIKNIASKGELLLNRNWLN
jgi:hypothetical protein